MRPLRIGINALYMIPAGVGGTEIYLRSLLLALDRLKSPHEFLIFANAESREAFKPRALPLDSGQFQIIETGVKARNRPWRLMWEQLALPGELRRRRIDVLLNPGYTAPVMSGRPQVTVFHDLQHKRHPEYFRWFDLPFWRAFLYASARRSRLIIAVSEATGQDFISHYRTDASRVRVVHHGVDPEFFGIRERWASAAEGRYILTVSTQHPHKNFRRLLMAYANFLRKRPDIRLVIAGLRGFDSDQISKLMAELKLADKVTCTGWIAREELYKLFAGADSFIYPTTFEGFGMTLLEGMAAGLPVACSDIEPVRSIAGGAALLFRPESTSEIEDALVRITEDEVLRNGLRQAGPCRARQFSWDETARLTLEAMVEAASVGYAHS